MLKRTLSLGLVVSVVVIAAGSMNGGETNGKVQSVATSPAGCCEGTTGNVSMTGIIDLTDLAMLIGYLTITPKPVLPCPEAANVTGTGIIDLTDLSMLIGYLTITPRPTLPNCPGGISFADRQAAFDAIDSVAGSIGNVGRDSLSKALLTFINSRSEYEDAGISQDKSVWARFTDGRVLIIPNNRFPEQPVLDTMGSLDLVTKPVSGGFVLPARRFGSKEEIRRAAAATTTPAATTYELPHSITAFLGNTLSGHCFTSCLRYVKLMLEDNGYVTTVGSTVQQLLGVQNYGFFMIEAHGGIGYDKDDMPFFALSTTTQVTFASDTLFATMLNNHELVYFLEYDWNGFQCTDDLQRYAFTGDFVAQYMSFTPNSFVYASACGSDEISMKDGFEAAGASVYAGWTYDTYSEPSNKAGLFVIQRMLGIDDPMPSYAAPNEWPRQRPFDITQLWQDMKNRDYDSTLVFDTVNGVVSSMPSLFVVSKLRESFELLAPSIRYLQVLPRTDTVEMTGYFGSDPGNKGHVFVNGVERPILSWEPWLIRFDLPPSGPGSAGPVTVELDPISGPSAPKRRISNPVNLTQWNGTFTYSEQDAGTLKKQISMTVKIRADVHSFREYPHDTTLEMNQFIVFGRVEGDTGRVAASGQWIYHAYDEPYEDWTYEWSDSTLIFLMNEPDPNQGFLYQGFIKHSGSNRWMELNLFGNAYTGMTQTVTSSLSGLLSTEDLAISPVLDVYDDFLTFGAFTLFIPFYPDWATFGGTKVATICCSLDADNPDVTAKMTWTIIVPIFPPDSTVAR